MSQLQKDKCCRSSLLPGTEPVKLIKEENTSCGCHALGPEEIKCSSSIDMNLEIARYVNS